MRLLLLLLLAGCASQLTEAELELRQYEEQERVIAYRHWQQACLDAGGHVFINNPIRPCHTIECIPDKHDWSQYRRLNRAMCVK